MLYCISIVLYCTGIVFCVVFYCAIRVGQISSKFIGGTAMKNPMHAFCYAGHQRIDVGNNVRNCHKDRKLPFAFSLVSSFPKFSIVFFWRFGDIARTCLDQNFTSTTVSGYIWILEGKGERPNFMQPSRKMGFLLFHPWFGPIWSSSMARIRGLLADPDADEPGDGWMVSTSLSESWKSQAWSVFSKHSQRDFLQGGCNGVLQQDS